MRDGNRTCLPILARKRGVAYPRSFFESSLIQSLFFFLHGPQVSTNLPNMDSSTNSFDPDRYVSLSDLHLLQSTVNITTSGEYVKASGIQNIRLTSPIYWAGEDSYGKSDVSFRVTKEEYESYLTYYDNNIQPKLAAFYRDPSAVVLGRANKKKKNNALEVKHASFYNDSKSDNGGMIMKFRVNKSSVIKLVKEEDNYEIEVGDIKWKYIAEAFGFFGITRDKDGVFYLRLNLNRLYIKHNPELEKTDEVESQAYVPSFFLPSSYTLAEAITEL